MRTAIVCLVLFTVPPLAMLGFKGYEEYQAELRSIPALPSGDEVLFFNASWCGPCRQMKPVVTSLRHKGYRLRDVDVDRNRALAAKYDIHAVPTFVFIHRGREVSRFSGGTSPESLRELCANYR